MFDEYYIVKNYDDNLYMEKKKAVELVITMVVIVMGVIASVVFDKMVLDKHNYNTYRGILKDRNIEIRVVEAD
jgi:hypothetical protein